MNPFLKTLTNIGLISFLGSPLWAAPIPDIQVDQTGYLPNETKLAMVTNAAATGTFYLVNTSGPATVLTGTLSAAAVDTNSGLSIRDADFSSVTTPGTYYLYVAGLGQSYNFTIGTNVYSNAFYETTRFYYGQRCGTAVTVGNAGTTWSHGACHTTGAADSDNPASFHASSGKAGTKASTKGWHDAGDYGKYIVNANISVGELLWAYEWYPAVLSTFNLNLPESGNGTPDILNECRWELEWMLTMQDTDGGVWAKVTSAGFPAGPPTLVMPENDNAGTRYIIGTNNGSPYKDSGATAGYAAVMAIAARLYQPFDPAFSAACSQAAVTAWGWVSANPSSYTTGNPAGISTGIYGDGGANSTPSYLLWAAAELYRTTGNATYNTYFTTNYTHFAPLLSGTQYPQDWTDTKNLGYWSYYFTGKNGIQPISAAVSTAIYNATTGSANTVIARQATDGYRVSLQGSDYIWGSNGGVGNYGILLLMANAMSANASYVQSTLDDIHYLLGRNGNKISFVTDLGSSFQMNPHHRPSWSDGITLPWPGMLAGGPNASGGDGITPTTGGGTKAALCYIDNNNAYASNEEAVNWNAPLVFILASTLQAGVPTPTPTNTVASTPTPTPSNSPTRTPTATPTRTPTLTPTNSLTVSPTNSPTLTPSNSLTRTPTPSVTNSATNSPTRTPSPTATNSPSASATNSPTLTPSNSPTRTPTPSLTNTPSNSPTPSVTNSTTNSPTRTPTFTTTNSPTSSPTNSPTHSPTYTPTRTASSSPTDSPTTTPTSTPTITNTPTDSPTGTLTPTHSFTPSNSPTNSPTFTVSSTPTSSFTMTASNTATATPSNSPTPSPTLTATNSPSSSPTNSPSSTASNSPSSTASLTPTLSPTGTSTNTPSLTPSSTPTTTGTSSSTSTFSATNSPTKTPTSSPTATPSNTSTWTVTFTPTGTPTNTPTAVSTPTSVPTATPAGAITFSAVYPNPSLDALPITVDIGLPGPATVNWAVFTTAFRKIDAGTLSLAASGPFRWDLKDKTGTPVAKGLYYLRLEVSGDFGSAKKVFKILVF